MECSLCRDTGWLLEAKHRNGVLTLELIPCLIPDCKMSGYPVELISVDALKLDRVSRHPSDKYIMSLAN